MDSNNTQEEAEEPIEVIYDTFNLQPPHHISNNEEEEKMHRTAIHGSKTEVFVDRPTLRASMAQGLFLGGTGRRAVAHTHPEFPKMPSAPSAFSLLGAPQAPGN